MNPKEKTTNPLHYWAMWLLGALFYAYETLMQVSLNVMGDNVSHDLALSPAAYGVLGSWFFLTYAGLQLPAGLWLDRFGVRRISTLAILVCASGSLLFAHAHVIATASLARLLLGVGSAFAALSCMKIAASWLPAKRFAMLTGCMLTIGMLGAITAQLPLHWLVEHFGWRSTSAGLGYFGLVLGATVSLVVRDKNSRHDAQKASKLLVQLKNTVCNLQSWLIALYGGMVFWSTPILGGMWGSMFLRMTRGMTEEASTKVIQFIFIGWAVGAPLFGWLSDVLQRRKPSMYIASIGSLVCLSCFTMLRKEPIHWLYIELFLLGFFISAFLPAFSLLKDNSEPHQLGGQVGFANAINMVGPVFLNPLIGFLMILPTLFIPFEYFVQIMLHWNFDASPSVHKAAESGAHTALLILPVCALASLVILPFIKEKKARRVTKV